MRSRFDEQLAQLERELIEMGALCEEVIALASKALTEADPSDLPEPDLGPIAHSSKTLDRGPTV